MAKVWSAGRESSLLDDIIAGRKTIKARLNRGKFADYRVGDTVSLRRDYRGKDGQLRDGEPDVARVEIVGIRHYSSFLDMLTSEDYRRVIPRAQSREEAVAEYSKYYSAADQEMYHTLAIEIKLVTNM